MRTGPTEGRGQATRQSQEPWGHADGALKQAESREETPNLSLLLPLTHWCLPLAKPNREPEAWEALGVAHTSPDSQGREEVWCGPRGKQNNQRGWVRHSGTILRCKILSCKHLLNPSASVPLSPLAGLTNTLLPTVLHLPHFQHRDPIKQVHPQHSL